MNAEKLFADLPNFITLSIGKLNLMQLKIRFQLSSMMFFQFFIWGIWYVNTSTYLLKIGFDGLEIGQVYSAIPIGAIVSPFFIGLIADKFFSAQKVLGIMHIIGGCLLYFVSSIQTSQFFFFVLLLYAMCYMPTLALVNAISFNKMNDPGTEFPNIRVFGTAGWIVAGTLISFLDIEDTNIPLQIAAAISIGMGIYSFTLPKCPPKSIGQKTSISDILGLEALGLMKDRSFAIFVISSLLISIPLAFYYTFANPFLTHSGMENVTGKMTIGQLSEIVFMIIMPFLFARLGVKKMLLIGMLAWFARYLLFAFGNNEELVFMFYLAIVFHGICYDFFFVTGQIYVDKKAPKAIQASAQGFITLITYGVGMLIGSYVSGGIVKYYTEGDQLDWISIWMFPAAMALLVSIAFLLLFQENFTSRNRKN